MPTKKELEEKTVAELKELAAKQELEGRSTLTTKDELVSALSSEQRGKAGEPTPDRPAEFPLAGMEIKGTPMGAGKGETRLFQTSGNVKEWLTKEEAEKKGFYWKDEPKVKATRG